MLWELRYPASERRRREQEAELRRAAGRAPIDPVPDPEPVHEDLHAVLAAWQELAADRGPLCGLIPWVARSQWCRDHGIFGDELLRWCRLIGILDAEYLAATRKNT